MTEMHAGAPVPGFADPVFDAQSTFRALLDAMARPGSVADIGIDLNPPSPLSAVAAAVALTLFDHDTPVWLDGAAGSDEVRGFLAFHCGSPMAESPTDAAFAVLADAPSMPALDRFDPGSDAYPDSSTTLVIDVPALNDGTRITLKGPGIAEVAVLAPAGLPLDFWSWMAVNRSIFPLGVDVILTCGRSLACLPRTTLIEVQSCT
jgi:alpha-D-ribose 1-methylphosphonate 5-triphosphate synthase subunit PhnH